MVCHEKLSLAEVMTILEKGRNERNRTGMARFGIVVDNAYGVSVKYIRQLAKRIGRDHGLALGLWGTNVHEARILASIVDDPRQVNRRQMDLWVGDFDSWDICDQCCSNLFARTNHAWEVIDDWCRDDREFVRRAGFVLLAVLAVKDKRSNSNVFAPYLALMQQKSTDPRNNVKKAVNWALRQIGKRDMDGRALVLPLIEELASSKDRTARWIAKDALRELNDPKQMERIMARSDKTKVTMK